MKTATPDRFKALDACHKQIHDSLSMLVDMLQRLDAEDDVDLDDAVCRKIAGDVEVFFSGTSRQHHLEEETNIFPALLKSSDAELVHAVQTLQQDHNWIELNWTELAPMLRAIAQGEDWIDMAELRHTIEVFVALCHDHITLEETLIYPEARAQLAGEMASRKGRKAPVA